MESRVLNELRRSWAPRVRSYLASNGGSARLRKLGGAVRLPEQLQGQVRYAHALQQCRFVKLGDMVHLPGSAGEQSQRVVRVVSIGRGGRPMGRRTSPSSGQTLASIIGQRRIRSEEEQDYYDDDEARRPAQRRRTTGPSWSIDTRPSHDMPDDVPPPDGMPSRPSGAVNWSKWAHSWRSFEARSDDQERYMELLASDEAGVVVALGKAGTGKTLLAVQEGLRQLRDGRVRKIILGRPAVTADEDLGFLPGSEKDKLTPFLLPLLDAIDKVMGPGAWMELQRRHLLELQSFAYMRGRTHEEAFVIADEVQNASLGQLKLLATRVGEGSRLCILGDGSQPDRRLGANWAGGGPDGRATSIELFVDFVEDGGLERAGLPAHVANACVRVARLSTCQRSDTAAYMLQAMERFEQEVAPPQAREHGQSAAGLLRQAMAQAARG